MEIPPRAALFLDLASLEAMSSHHGVRVSHGEFLERLIRDRRLVRAAAYGARDDDHPEAEERLASLAAEGFKVVAKPLWRRADGVRRASLSVNIAVDALELAPHLDALSLVTTDGDFSTLIEAVQRRGVRVEVVTSRELASAALVEAADAVIEFASLVEPGSPGSRRPRSIPTERGNARPRLDPPPRRRSRRRSGGRRDTEPGTTPPAAEAAKTEPPAKPTPAKPAPAKPAPAKPAPAKPTPAKPTPAKPTPAAPSPEPAAPAEPAKPSESKDAAPPQAAVKVLPQESLSGRAVRAKLDEA